MSTRIDPPAIEPDAPIGIVVLTWRDFENTAKCLDSLLAMRPGGLPARIFVVDNHSEDGSFEALATTYALANSIAFRQTDVNRGFGGGNNFGIRWALAEGCGSVILLNNDCVVPVDLLERISRALRTYSDAAVITGKVLYAETPSRIWYAGGHLSAVRAIGIHERMRELDDTTHDQARIVSYVPGCFLVVRRAVLEDVGLFDERFFIYFDDVEYCRRLRRAGRRIVYVPQLVVRHKVGGGSRVSDYSRLYLRLQTRNRVLCYQDTSLPYFLYVKLLTLLISTMKALALIRRGRYLEVKAVVTGCIEGLRIPRKRGLLQD